jgi:hypothetical protein
MFTHGGYNPKTYWYVFYADKLSDLNADFVSKSRQQAEEHVKKWMKKHFYKRLKQK